MQTPSLARTGAIAKETVEVKIFTTNQNQIRGYVNVTGAYRCRLSDLLNNDRPFISLTNVKIYDAKGGLLQRCEFLCVNKNSIDYVLEEDAEQYGLN